MCLVRFWTRLTLSCACGLRRPGSCQAVRVISWLVPDITPAADVPAAAAEAARRKAFSLSLAELGIRAVSQIAVIAVLAYLFRWGVGKLSRKAARVCMLGPALLQPQRQSYGACKTQRRTCRHCSCGRRSARAHAMVGCVMRLTLVPGSNKPASVPGHRCSGRQRLSKRGKDCL